MAFTVIKCHMEAQGMLKFSGCQLELYIYIEQEKLNLANKNKTQQQQQQRKKVLEMTEKFIFYDASLFVYIISVSHHLSHSNT